MRYKLITKGPAWFEDLHAKDKRFEVPLIEVERLMNVAEYSQQEIVKLKEEIDILKNNIAKQEEMLSHWGAPFVILAACGVIHPEAIDEYVDDWHNNKNLKDSMQIYLGMTDEEYDKWLLDANAIYHIVEQRQAALKDGE